jgi:translation initiation factor 2 alpha subunit (eIF-2alpha)
MEISIYQNKLPNINENVLVMFIEHKDTHIEAVLIEYEGINAMMTYESATRRKKIYDWKKEVPLNKLAVAKVEEICNSNYIQISIAYFDHRKDPLELSKELMKPFNDNKVLNNIVNKLCHLNSLDFNIFWESIIYKIDLIRREDDVNESLLDIFIANIETVNNLIKENYSDNICDKLINELSKFINIKTTKIVSKFSLITKTSINQTIELLNFVCEKNNDWNYNLKYITTPYFLLESLDENSNEENHKIFLNLLEENSSNYNVIYELI